MKTLSFVRDTCGQAWLTDMVTRVRIPPGREADVAWWCTTQLGQATSVPAPHPAGVTIGAFGADVAPYGGLAELENRLALHAVDQRDAEAATRNLLRQVAGVGTTPLRILVVGDSITVGANSVDGTGYRGYLADLLDRQHVTATIDASAAGGGLTLAGVTPLAGPALAAHAPDVVLLAVGTNDAPWASLVGWQAAYGALVDQCLAVPSVRGVACARITISDTSSDPVLANPAVPANAAQINGWVSSVVAARQATGRVAVADMSTIPPSWLTDAGWHPGDAGYLRMAQLWLSAITPWLVP